MYPQQFQGQPFTPQGIWGNAQTNLNEVVNAISRILPLLQLQASQLTPHTGTFGFPQQHFAQQGLMQNQNPIGHSGLPFGQQPFGQQPFGQQFSNPWAAQSNVFGNPQFGQSANLVEVVNVLSRILPVLQQTAMLAQSGVTGQQGNVFGLPQQHFAQQGIHPEIAGAISRILPFLGTQSNPFLQTGVAGFGSVGNPYIH